MIDDGDADDAFKDLQRRKLDALLALAEAHDCRRVRLLAYFGEAYRAPGSGPGSPGPDAPPRGSATEASPSLRCNNCDNCLDPPATWDATEAARKVLSCVYRFQQHGGFSFGAGHLIDVLRGKVTDKVQQHHHQALSTFGIGADLSEAEWRAVLRQLIALGHLRTEGEYHTLALTATSRAVLRGDVPVRLRVQAAAPKRGERSRAARQPKAAPLPLDETALTRFAALKAWRAEVAKQHGVPAFVIFHDATLAEAARECPADLDALAGVSGVGAHKLHAYGEAMLRVLHAPAEAPAAVAPPG